MKMCSNEIELRVQNMLIIVRSIVNILWEFYMIIL